MALLAIPQDLSEYNYVHVDATLDSEKQNLNFSLVDSELKDEWNGPLPAGIQYGVPTFPFTFDMAAKANSNNANGTLLGDMNQKTMCVITFCYPADLDCV